MFKSLILGAVCLISHACTFNSGSDHDVNSGNSNNCNIPRIAQPQRAINTHFNIMGVYNFKDQFNFYAYDFESEDLDTLHFEPIDKTQNLYCVPFIYDGGAYYLDNIQFLTDYYDSGDTIDLKLRFSYYDTLDTTYLAEIIIYDGSSLSDYTDNSLYNSFFNVCSSTPLSDYESDYFNSVFTSEDNSYLTSYSGYYSFVVSTHSFNQGFAVLGNMTFDTKVWYGFTNQTQNPSSIANYSLKFYGYDSINSIYTSVNYTFPFNTSKVVSNNMLISNGKMTIETRQYLNNIGVFAYQRDGSYDNTDMHDLIFSIMDSPIYMLSRLLNFELFGMNLFVALTGILTLVIVIVVIRKIW